MMICVRIELWMWLEEKLGKEFQSVSKMCSILQIDVEEGTIVRNLFKKLADRYTPVCEKIFDKDTESFHSNVVVIFNDYMMGLKELHEKVLEEGDTIKIFPMYVGG